MSLIISKSLYNHLLNDKWSQEFQQVCAFNLPYDELNRVFGAGFMANLFSTKFDFQNVIWDYAEAPFQALKNDPSVWHLFHNKRCSKVLHLSRHPRFNKNKYVNQSMIMYQILLSKFTDPKLKFALQSSIGFLLAHNPKHGKDITWSDNYDGSGQNLLGLVLMFIRAELQGDENTLCWLHSVWDFNTDRSHYGLASQDWQYLVNCHASFVTDIINDSVLSSSPIQSVPPVHNVQVARCVRTGCKRHAYMNKQGNYCSSECRDNLVCIHLNCNNPNHISAYN